MEPQNKLERKSAFGKFFGAYALSLIFPVGGMYMLSAVPDALSDSESGRYKLIVDEQKPIVTDADTLGNFAKLLLRQDGLAVSSPDPSVKGEAETKITQLESQIKEAMNRVKAKAIVQPQNQSLSRGVSSMAEVIVALRSNMSDLRLALNKGGIDAGALTKLQSELAMKEMESSTKQTIIATLQAQLAASGGAKSGGGGPDPQVPLLKNEIVQLKSSLKNSGNGSEVLRLQQKLEDCNNKSGGGTIIQGVPMADVLEYAKAEGFSELAFKQTKKFNDRQSYFDQAVDMFTRLEERSISQEMKMKAKARRLKLEADESKIPD
jgi:hypothetical protein